MLVLLKIILIDKLEESKSERVLWLPSIVATLHECLHLLDSVKSMAAVL